MDKPADRSKLFLPFAALTGFEEMVRAKTGETPLRHIRSDEENEALSLQMLSLRRGMRVCVTCWENGAYHAHTGVVRQADCALRILHLTNKHIPFDTIDRLEAVDLPGNF